MKKIIKEKDGYGIVQRDFMKMDISVYAKCVYTLLRTYSGERNLCYPSMKTICDDLKISKSTLIRAIKELEKIEMVVVRRSKKKDSNENSVNTYIPLSIMIEIDVEKVVHNDDYDRLGGTPQTPRGTPQTPGVVSEEYRKNNNIKNNKEEVLNINSEQGSLFDLNDFEDIKKPANENKKTLRQDVIEFWLKEFHPGWNFNATDGKKINSLIKKIQGTLKLHRGDDFTDEDTLNLFKHFCYSLDDFYKNETLSVLESKYDSIVERIKQSKNGKPTDHLSKRGVTNFKFNVPDPRGSN